jgi:hypothetical protein
MSNPSYPSIPEPVASIESLLESVRVMKITIELITGQLKGVSAGAPRIFVQSSQPNTNDIGDLWVNTTNSRMSYWNGSSWLVVAV